ncbi:MAG: glycosyltransferase family 4 protein [Bacillota bacterium]
MRIAMLHWAFPPTIGGVESHLAMLCPALVRKGHSVHLLTGAVDGKPDRYSWEGVYIRRTPLMDLNCLTPDLIRKYRDKIREELAEFIDEAKPDIIHAHNMHYFSPQHTAELLNAKARHQIPLVLTAHNVWADQTWEKLCLLSKGWDGVIAISRYIKKELVANGYSVGKITVIHHGIDTRRFAGSGVDDELVRQLRAAAGGRKVIFHPARMSLAKGSDTVVLAFSRLKQSYPGAFLLLAGTEKTVDWGSCQQGEIHRIKSMISEEGLEDSVLIRFFPWDEIPSAYKASDVVIYPSSFDEPFGLVLLEAMASGKPLVVTQVGGMPEIVTDGKTGFIIPPRSPDALAESIVRILSAPQCAEEMGRNAAFEVQRRFGLNRMVDDTINFYERVRRSTRRDLERRRAS